MSVGCGRGRRIGGVAHARRRQRQLVTVDVARDPRGVIEPPRRRVSHALETFKYIGSEPLTETAEKATKVSSQKSGSSLPNEARSAWMTKKIASPKGGTDERSEHTKQAKVL